MQPLRWRRRRRFSNSEHEGRVGENYSRARVLLRLDSRCGPAIARNGLDSGCGPAAARIGHVGLAMWAWMRGFDTGARLSWTRVALRQGMRIGLDMDHEQQAGLEARIEG